MKEKDEYHNSLESNKEHFENYYLKSFEKSEQQKFLETLISPSNDEFAIADIACGGGSLSYHLSTAFPNAHFHLADYNSDAVELAKKQLTENQFKVVEDDIYSLSNFNGNAYDLVFCWQTLSWLEDPQKALKNLIRICKPGGKIFLSSLFNLDHDVDIWAKIEDHSHPEKTLKASYNTYSVGTIKKWLNEEASSFKFHPFITPIDFHYKGRGIGTYTLNSDKGRLQISAGMLLNWAVLEIVK